jgi:hypothetical protein
LSGNSKSVKVVFAKLDAVIAQGKYAEEAVRTKEDIKKKMGKLTAKINKNKEAAIKEKEGHNDGVGNR